MKYVALIAIAGIVLLGLSGAIPRSSVGGPMVIALAFFAAALAVAIHEAWTQSRGVLGWILNIIIAFVAVFVSAPIAGMIFTIALPVQGSLAATGGPVMIIALAGTMGAVLLAVWGSFELLKKWR